MGDGALNGSVKLEDWNEVRDSVLDTQQRLIRLERAMHVMVRHTKHLEKLDTLPQIRDKLLDAATGRGQFDASTVRLITGILGSVILVLMLALAFILTGLTPEQYSFIAGLHK